MSTKPILVPLTSGALVRKTVAVAAGARSQPRRPFTTTPPWQAEPIRFHKTQNADLEKILGEINRYIILPSYLKQPQRRMIFDPDQKQRLLDAPITIELDGELVRYSHLSIRSIPAADRILKRAVDAFKQRDDWKNLEPLLVGMKQAGRVLPPDTRSKIIRRAAQQGCLDSLFALMRHAWRTGFLMNAHEPVSTFLCWTFRECVIEEHARAPALKRGMTRCATLFEEILPHDQHGGSPMAKEPHLKGRHLRFHLTRDPQLLAVPLGLAASHTLIEHEGLSDRSRSFAETERLARLVCTLWRPKNPTIMYGIGGQGLAGLHPQDSYYDANWTKYLRNANKRLEWEAVLVRSMEDAAEVLIRAAENRAPPAGVSNQDFPTKMVEWVFVAKQLGRMAEVIRAEAEVDMKAPIMSEERVGNYYWRNLVQARELENPSPYRMAEKWRPDQETRVKLRAGELLHPLDKVEASKQSLNQQAGSLAAAAGAA